MSPAEAPPAIRHSVTVDVPPQDAFAAFTNGMSSWWPREYTWSGDLLERVGIEDRPGGFCFEIGPRGMRLDWGRVEAWDPPRRLAFTWQVSPDRVPEPSPARASQVEVLFEPAGEARTRVSVTHDGWERHGEGAAEYRRRFDEANAWPTMLDRYAASVGVPGEAPWQGLTT